MRIVVGIAGMSCGALVAWALWSLWPHEEMLLNVARQVSAVKGVDVYTRYDWRNEQEVWLARFPDQPHEDPSVESGSLRRLMLVSCDTKTGTLRPLSALSHKLPVTEGGFIDWQFSPDRQWVMEHGRGGTHILRLDGSGLRHLEAGGRNNAVLWLGDSQHLLNLFGGLSMGRLDYSEVSLFSLNSNKAGRSLANSKANILVTAQTGIGTAGNKVFALQAGTEEGEILQEVTLIERTVLPADSQSVLQKVRLPEKAQMCELSFSPQCDRVACVLLSTSTYVSPILVWCHRLLHTALPFPRTVTRLWVYHLRIHRWKEIGVINQGVLPDKNDTFPGNLCWLPQGKSLSFVYKNTLWRVPVE